MIYNVYYISLYVHVIQELKSEKKSLNTGWGFGSFFSFPVYTESCRQVCLARS